MNENRFYLILSEYVGPNDRDSRGNFIGDSRVMEIHTRPGKTNSSHEERLHGWLGTTNDISLTAYGEFDSIEDSRAAVQKMGFTVKDDFDDDEPPIDESLLEQWITPAAAREQWDADDWFQNYSHDMTREEFGITESTTDDELDEIIKNAVDEAAVENVTLHNTDELFYKLRNELAD